MTANETGLDADYQVAIDLLERLLVAEPENHEMEWLLAHTYLQTEAYQEATLRCASLISSRDKHPYGDGALVVAVDAWRMFLEDEYGGTDVLPVGAELEQTTTGPDGKTVVNIYALSEHHTGLINAVDMALAHTFVPGDNPSVDYRAQMELNRPLYAYLAAHVLYTHHRFDQARPRLESIFASFPDGDMAAYSRNLILESYRLEGDFKSALQAATLRVEQMASNPDGARKILTQANKLAAEEAIAPGTEFAKNLAALDGTKSLSTLRIDPEASDSHAVCAAGPDRQICAGTRIERYVVESLLGRGAMATVFKVRHQQLNSVHALKVLFVRTHDVERRLLQEGTFQGQLHHPNILMVTDVVDMNGSP
ncbi:MAG: tetratricopeptide repeat protein, partial [Proteobacteria bacterium]|nr:tetratricopeptide repeat protein [Pseudomonadota bacterium]